MGEIILIDKRENWTSFDVVNKIRHLIKVKKVGHAGTLDPMATGLLIVCTGKKTKQISQFQNLNKVYSGIFKLGEVTDTFDSAGKVIETGSLEEISEEKILKTKEKFIGEILQTPPMYSAKKVKGKALYKYARKGIEVKREPVRVRIFDFEIVKVDLPEVHFKVTSSKGFYVRALANDFGRELGCGAHLSGLRREAIGDYSVEEALSIDEFEKLIGKN